MLTKYLKSYIISLLIKKNEDEEEDRKEVKPHPKRAFGLSLRQVLKLDNDDDLHIGSIADNFHHVYEISDAVRRAGLEESNVIIGIDFSASNEWQGRQSFHHKSLHYTRKKTQKPVPESYDHYTRYSCTV